VSTCNHCQKEYQSGTNRQNQQYCSPDCRIAANNDKRKVKRACLNCGKETSTKYCSTKCGTKYRNDRRNK